MRGFTEKELTARQQKALAALLAHPTVAEAAREARVSEATLYRHLRDESFKAAYRRARSEIVEHSVTQLQRGAERAARALCEICEDCKAPASARVAAARAILDGAMRAVELQDLVERTEEVAPPPRIALSEEQRARLRAVLQKRPKEDQNKEG